MTQKGKSEGLDVTPFSSLIHQLTLSLNEMKAIYEVANGEPSNTTSSSIRKDNIVGRIGDISDLIIDIGGLASVVLEKVYITGLGITPEETESIRTIRVSRRSVYDSERE